ncbi:MAG: ANTAR domain-containing response regulator [Candidatus Nanopelagicaceae bacterium]|jgi:AmiR/NasT family two-component response regulator
MTDSQISAKRILIAEDETLIRMDLAEMLKESGYEVIAEATNGEEAIALASELKPDLAILDVKMPKMDGISAAEVIVKTSPVLMLTAFSQKDLVERALDAGVMAYVVKPFTIDDLIPAIEIATARYQQLVALQAEISDLNERLETRKIIDRAKGLLMQAMKLSEPEAFKWIQRTAMDKRVSMKAVAEAVIDPSRAQNW